MAQYKIRNLTKSRVHLPNPINKTLNGLEYCFIDTPASLVDTQTNSKKNRFQSLIESGMIEIETVQDPENPNKFEVPTISMLSDFDDLIITTDGAIVYVNDGDFVLKAKVG